MTTDEAIYILKNTAFLLPSRGGSIDEVDEALTMAVKALEEQQWIPCSKRLPETGEKVFVTCEHLNIYGKTYHYVCKAYHVDRYTMKSDANLDECCEEYREEDDEFYILEGWYEYIHNWDDFGSVSIEDKITAWMPLPEPYKESGDD